VTYEVVEPEPLVVGGSTYSGAATWAAEYVVLKGHGVTVPIRRDQLAEMEDYQIEELLRSYTKG
jgi:hypothetical protein